MSLEDSSWLIEAAKLAGAAVAGAGALRLKFRISDKEARHDDREEQRSTREELQVVLTRLQESQLGWMRERAELHQENLQMKEKLSRLTQECEGLRHSIDRLQKEMEAVRETEGFFWRNHFQQAPFPVLRVAADGQILQANEAFENKFGYPDAKIQGMTWQEITHPDDLEADLAMVAECLAGARSRYSMRKRYRKALSEEWVPFDLHVVAHRRHGRFLYFTSFLLPTRATEASTLPLTSGQPVENTPGQDGSGDTLTNNNS